MQNSKSVLDGIRVIDFGQYIAGPLAAMILADFGAEVIHVDPPGGPVWDVPANAVLMRGKKNIVLDLKKAGDLATAKRLISSADVVIENFRPGVMDRLGLGAKECLDTDPALVYCSIPGFSEKDEARRDWPGWEGIVSSEAGLYRVSRYDLEGDAPSFYSLTIASNFAAIMAVHSIMAALMVVEKCGRGQRVEVPLYDACFEAAGIFARDPKGKPSGGPNRSPRTSFRDLQGYPCKDGRYVQLSPPMRGMKNLWNYIIPEEFEEVDQSVKDRIAAKFKEHTMLEWEDIGQNKLKAGVSAVYSSEEWLHDSYALESGSVAKTVDPVLGEIYAPGCCVLMSETPGTADNSRHLPDQDREEILAGLDEAVDAHAKKTYGNEPVPKAPLEGIKILDLCQILAGPISARIASEYGASVIKVNNPRTSENPTAMAGHDTVNNGKATTFIDLKSDDGRKLLEDLIKDADVFHCNFTPEALKRLGIDEASLRKINPDIIVSQVNVHSAGGFRGEFRGHEELGEAITGMTMRQSGTPAGHALPITYCDNSTGDLSNVGVLMALYHRLRTGEPQFVQASLSRSGGFLQLPYMLSYSGKVWDEPAGPGIKGWNACDRFYRASDVWIWINAVKVKDAFYRLCGSAEGACDADAAKTIEAVIAQKTAGEWISILSGIGAAACTARDFCADSMEEPYAIERGLSMRKEHKGLGVIRTIGASQRLSLTPNHAPFPVSAPGSDTEEVVKNGWNFSLKR